MEARRGAVWRAAGRRSPARPIAPEGQGCPQPIEILLAPRRAVRLAGHSRRHYHNNERKSDSPNLNRMRGRIKMKALFILRV